MKHSGTIGCTRVLVGEYPAAKESGSFSRMENELYKQFFSEIIAEAESGLKGGKQFLDFIRFDLVLKEYESPSFRLACRHFRGGCT